MPADPILGCSTFLKIYEYGDGTYAGKGAEVTDTHDEIFDMTLPNVDFGEIDTSDMSQAVNSYRQYIPEGFTDWGNYSFQANHDPKINPALILSNQLGYWMEIEFDLLQDTEINGNVLVYFLATLIGIDFNTPFDDKAASTYNFRLKSEALPINS